MTAIDLDGGPVWLLVSRGETGIDVTRISEDAWRFTSELFAARPLQAALEAVPDIDASTLLAEHLAAGRFIDFRLINRTDAAS